MTRRPRYGPSAGVTLIEIMIVIAIVAVVASGVALSFRQVQRAETRGSAARLSSAIRYLYDQAVVTGKYYRLTINLEKDTYKAEKSEERFFLTAGKEPGPGRGKAFDADAETKRLDEEEKRAQEDLTGLAKQLQPPPTIPRAHFQAFADTTLPEVTLKNAWIRDVYTPRQKEPYTEGKTFLYFFPDGHTEACVIHVVAGTRPKEDDEPPRADSDEKPSVFTLIVHPLTGRVELKGGDIEVPRDFDSMTTEGDAEGVQ